MRRVTIQSELSALADFILSHKNEIINRFIEEVDLNPDIHPKGGLIYTYKQLVGHLPMIIETLSNVLQREQGDEMKLGESGASAIHGYIRWQQGFKLDELIGELSILGRLVLVDYLAMFAQRNPGFSGQVETIVRKIITILFANIMLSSVRQYVEETNLILQRTNEELRRVDESRLLFTRTVAHELTNLLNGIQGPAQLLEMGLDEATRQMMISMMRRNATDMKMLLQQLLDYSAMLAGHEQIQEASFEPQSLLDELISTFKPMADAKGLQFAAENESDLAVIVSDRLKIKQIASNLLSNAIKYTGKGRVSISFRLVDHERWAMIVKDTGVGIESHEIGRAFEEFQRIEPRANIRGTGLGLAITKRLVELLGGHIKVQSEVNRGSRFEVIFPLKKM